MVIEWGITEALSATSKYVDVILPLKLTKILMAIGQGGGYSVFIGLYLPLNNGIYLHFNSNTEGKSVLWNCKGY